MNPPAGTINKTMDKGRMEGTIMSSSHVGLEAKSATARSAAVFI